MLHTSSHSVSVRFFPHPSRGAVCIQAPPLTGEVESQPRALPFRKGRVMPATKGQQLTDTAAAAATRQLLSLQQEGGAITIVDGLAVVAGAIVAAVPVRR